MKMILGKIGSACGTHDHSYAREKTGVDSTFHTPFDSEKANEKMKNSWVKFLRTVSYDIIWRDLECERVVKIKITGHPKMKHNRFIFESDELIGAVYKCYLPDEIDAPEPEKDGRKRWYYSLDKPLYKCREYLSDGLFTTSHIHTKESNVAEVTELKPDQEFYRRIEYMLAKKCEYVIYMQKIKVPFLILDKKSPFITKNMIFFASENMSTFVPAKLAKTLEGLHDGALLLSEFNNLTMLHLGDRESPEQSILTCMGSNSAPYEILFQLVNIKKYNEAIS